MNFSHVFSVFALCGFGLLCRVNGWTLIGAKKDFVWRTFESNSDDNNEICSPKKSFLIGQNHLAYVKKVRFIMDYLAERACKQLED